jgi:hypothetical protein
MADAITALPEAVPVEIGTVLLGESPTQLQVQQLRSDLLSRHLSLRGLKPTVSSEEIVEAYHRCVLTDRLARAHALAPAAVPQCINSSHRAVRRVCVTPGHNHASIEDRAWANDWGSYAADTRSRYP